MAAGLPLPKRILAHGWLLFEQEKMSKSKGNVAYPEPIVKVLGQRRAALLPAARNRFRPGRQFFARSTDHALQRRLGERPGKSRQPRAGDDRELFRRRRFRNGQTMSRDVSASAFNRSRAPLCCSTMTNLISRWRCKRSGNSISLGGWLPGEQGPWKMAADPSKRPELAEVLYNAAEAVRMISVLAHPVIPDATRGHLEASGSERKYRGSGHSTSCMGRLEAGDADNKARGGISARGQKRGHGKDRSDGTTRYEAKQRESARLRRALGAAPCCK